MPTKLAAGNWKMNGVMASLSELDNLSTQMGTPECDVMICPPATLISAAATQTSDTPIAIGAQDCHAASSGAHTGDLSAPMLRDAGATAIIVGHSERRADHAESDADVRAKASAAIADALTAIVCVGEELHEREADKTLEIIGGQLAGSLPDDIQTGQLVVAYEPVWAIGTGKVPTVEQIAEVHDFIRETLIARYGADIGSEITLLYGGSVKASNATDIFKVAHVNGALVGGASLTAADFAPIVAALSAS